MFFRLGFTFNTACLAVAAISALSLSFLRETCASCDVAMNMAPVANLHIYGALVYTLLILLPLFPKTKKFFPHALFFAAGCQLALLYVLLVKLVACIPCIICAVCVMSAALTTLKITPRHVVAVSAVAGLAVCAGAMFLQQKQTRMLREASTARNIGFSTWEKQKDGPIKISVFALDSCTRCQEFKREMLPLVQERYGKYVEIESRQAPPAIIIPTIVVGGESPLLLVGKPTWNELANAIELNMTAVDNAELSMGANECIETKITKVPNNSLSQ